MLTEPIAVPLVRVGAEAGPKAGRLGALLRAGVPVPPGLALTPASVAALLARPVAARTAWLEAALADLPGPWIARSSAAVEDRAGASLAGSFMSVRDRQTPAAVAAAIEQIDRDARRPELAALLAHVGAGEIGLGIIVQQQVAATTGGVVFTRFCGPDVSGLLIELAVGGPQDLVGGGRADESLLLDAGDRPLSGALTRLPAARTAQLVALARRIEVDEGGPQDIEWADDGERLWIVQTRPIAAPRAEVAGDLWTAANSQEALPGVVTALTWSLLFPAVDRGLRQLLEALGLPDFTRPYMTLHHGRAYFNVTLFAEFARTVPGLPPDLFEHLILGGAPAEELSTAMGPRALLTLLRSRVGRRGFGLALAVLPGARRRLERACARARWQDRRLGGEPPAALDDRALLRRTGRIQAAVFRGFLGHCLGTSLSGGYLELALLFGAWSGLADEARILDVVAAPGPSPSHRMARALTRLAGDLQAAPDLLAALRAAPEPARLAADARLGPAWQRLLAGWGHQAVGPGELASARVREDPRPLLETLLTLADAPPPLPPARPALPGWLARARGWRGLLLRHLVRRARRFHPYREAVKFDTLRLMARARETALEAGRRLCERGLLPSAEAVFDLRREELEAGLLEGRETLAAQAHGRATERARQQRIDPPFLMVEQPDGRRIAMPPPGAGRPLTGVCAAPGTVRGRARVITDARRLPALAAGEILVAPAADAAWCAVFMTAGGVVLEAGSRLSHSAILARELGVPCLIGVEDATRRIPDGAEVVLDATRGRVVVAE